jgi:nitronate monooxygenase
MRTDTACSGPLLIQGGMGAGVSGWRLAQAVSSAGQLGVVSGTALALIMARRLAVGDPGGHMRNALAAFPVAGVAQRILDRYYIEGGKSETEPFKSVPMPQPGQSSYLDELMVASNFAEVWLAKQGHSGVVGINLLEKIQLPTLPSLFGAMLAGVDYVLMGAGIPRAIPGILDQLAALAPTRLRLDVEGADSGDEHYTHFDPSAFCGDYRPKLQRPKFLAIISSVTLAQVMARKASGKVDGFIVEGPTAGGHNAPPRGKIELNAESEPIYGERDRPDLGAIAKLGIPFWLAGSYAEPGRIAEALECGAAGVQIGTAFAYCEESDLAPEIKAQALAMSRTGTARVLTDPVASPTGFPFKVMQVDQTLSNPELYAQRQRICDLGYLRHAYLRDDGKLGWRCPAEPVDDFAGKQGEVDRTEGRKCVCNGLMANIGLGQVRLDAHHELPLITSGDDVANIARFAEPDADGYTAGHVIDYLLGTVDPAAVV